MIRYLLTILFVFLCIQVTQAQTAPFPFKQNLIRFLGDNTCRCLNQKAVTDSVTVETLKFCLQQALTSNEEYVEQESGIKISQYTDVANARKLGMDIVAVMKGNCPIYQKLEQLSSSRKLIANAQNLYDKGQPSEAAALLNTLIINAIGQFDKTIYNLRGQCRIETKDYFGALADFQYAVELDPMFAIAIGNRGMVKQKIGANQSALDDYTKAIELDSTQANFYSNRGELYYDSEMWDEAEVDFRKAVMLNPKDADKWYYLGLIKREKEEYTDEAVSFFDKAIALNAKAIAAINQRGLLYQDRKQPDKAKADFLAAIKIDNDFNAAHYNVALIYMDEKQHTSALKHANEAIRIDSSSAQYRGLRAKVYRNMGKFSEALTDVSTAITLSQSKNADYFDQRAAIYGATNKIKQAIDDYSTSISLYDKDGAIYWERGKLRLKTGDKKGACDDFAMGTLYKNEESEKALKATCGK